MKRFSASLVLFGLLGISRVAASPQTDATEEINAQCDNNCFFTSFPGGSCTNDAACMCDQQTYREAYFCCMGKNCAPSVLPDSIQRQNYQCGLRNMPFTFDSEAVCGIKLAAASSSPTLPASTPSPGTGNSESLAVSSSTTATTTATTVPAKSTTSAPLTASTSTGTASSSGTPGPSTSKSQTSSGGGSTSTPKPTTNSAPVKRVMSNSIAILVAAFGLLL